MKSTVLARNYSLDAARGILMMLGALIHASNIYSVANGWLIHDGGGSYFFDLLVKCIHVFRMPTFFWISGFFCAMTFERSGSHGLVRKRLPRILIPLVVTWATLNIAQVCFLAWFRGEDVMQTLSDGVPIYHLWFLVDLMLFILSASLILPILKNKSVLGEKLDTLTVFLTLIAATLMSFLISVAVRFTGIAYEPILHLTTLFRLASYAPFFIVGALMFGQERLRQTFFRIPLAALIPALPLALAAQKLSHHQSIVVSEAAHLVELFMTWIIVSNVLRLFHDLVKKESPITRFLSDSAYTVYLFHHILVIVAGCFLMRYSFDSRLKFAIVCVSSIGISMLLHVILVRKNSIARLLFNGK